jgi:two-component system sensor histidine kinase RegB
MQNRFAPSALQLNLQRLLNIRLIVFMCQILALFYAYFVLELALSYTAIISIFLLLAVLNGGLYLRLHKRSTPGEGEFFLHLLLDVLGLSVLLYLSGGASNPFVSYFLVPVTIAAATLSWTHTGLLATLALACYTVLLFYYQPLELLMPAVDHSAHMHEAATTTSTLNLHTVGMWFNFMVSAALITWFVVKMAAEIRRQQERLSRYREDTLRNEQILAVATQAAGTAHELGTPLGTMAVLLKDLQLENSNNPVLLGDLQILQQQVEACRRALQQLSKNADFRNLQREELALDVFMKQLQDQWQLLRPELPSTFRQQDGKAPLVQVDLTLRQALINILNNAAEASPEGIALNVGWDNDNWHLQVRDFGEGISRELQEQLGTSIISTKEGGMGVGLVLSQATITRFGGKVSLYPLNDGKGTKGTLTEIILPLGALAGYEHD